MAGAAAGADDAAPAPDAPAATCAVEKTTPPSAGRLVVPRDGTTILALAPPWPTEAKTATVSPLFPNAAREAAPASPASPVDLRRHRPAGGAAGGADAAAVLGSGLGFLAAAYLVAWRAGAPFAGRSPYVFDRQGQHISIKRLEACVFSLLR